MTIRCLENPLPAIGSFDIRGDEAHHLIKVRRVSVGEKIEILDGVGGCAQAKIIDVAKRHVTVAVESVRRDEHPKPIGLGIALPMQLSTFSSLLPGLVQVGMTHLYVLESEFSGRLRKVKAQNDRFQSILHQSLKQCGRTWCPSLQWMTFEDLLKDRSNLPFDTYHLYHPGGCHWNQISAGLGQDVRLLNLVGPEGGFSEDEVQLAKQNGMTVLGLGEGILKMETAAIGISFRAAQWFQDLQESS